MKTKETKQMLNIREILPNAHSWQLVGSGIDSQVYQVELENGSLIFLRMGRSDQSDKNYQYEVKMHDILRQRGVKVPEVVYFNQSRPNVMVVAEIPGGALSGQSKAEWLNLVIKEAGSDLARINSVPCQRFGWIDSESKSGELTGCFPDYPSFVLRRLDDNLSALVKDSFLTAEESKIILAIIQSYHSVIEIDQGFVTHADYNHSHIFAKDGRYTGAIDFSDMASAHSLADVAHYSIFEPDYLESLLEGYQQVAVLSDDWRDEVSFLSLLIAIEKSGWYVREILHDAAQEKVRKLIGEHFKLILKAIKREMNKLV